MDSIKARLCAGGAVFFALAMSPGCSTYFNAVRIPTSNSTVPTAGAPYSLSFTTYDIAVSRRLTGCWAWTGEGPNRIKEAKLVISSEVKATPTEKPDPTQNYVIDIGSLGSFWKTTETEIKWNSDTGGLESISASAEDTLGTTAVTILTALAKTIVATTPVGAGMTNNEPTGSCEKTIRTIVNEMKDKKEEIAKATAVLERDNKKLANDSAAAKLIGDDITKPDKIALATLQKSVGKQISDLSLLQATFDDNLKKITYLDKITWPPNGAIFGEVGKDGKNVLSNDRSVKAAEIVPALTADQIAKWGTSGWTGEEFQQTRILAKIVASSPLSVTNPCTNNCETDEIKGLKYRPKSAGYLLVCQSVDCIKDDANAVGVQEGMISQLGHVYVIPLKSGVFSNKTLSATFDKVGQPTMIGVTSKSASEGAATATAAVFDQFVTARKAIIPSETDRLRDKIDKLKLEKELADTVKALKPDSNEALAESTAAFTADKVNIDAKVALISAQKTLVDMTKTL